MLCYFIWTKWGNKRKIDREKMKKEASGDQVYNGTELFVQFIQHSTYYEQTVGESNYPIVMTRKVIACTLYAYTFPYFFFAPCVVVPHLLFFHSPLECSNVTESITRQMDLGEYQFRALFMRRKWSFEEWMWLSVIHCQVTVERMAYLKLYISLLFEHKRVRHTWNRRQSQSVPNRRRFQVC